MSAFYRLAKSVSNYIGRQSYLVSAVRPLGQRVLTTLCRREGLTWSINSVPCKIDAAFRAQMATDYDRRLAECLRDRIRPGHVCVDVGANIGVWVIQLSHWVGPNGHVYAFEPNPTALKVLQRHVTLNQLEGRVTVFAQAVSDECGQATLHAYHADGMSRLEQANPVLSGSTEAVHVDVTTLDRWTIASGGRPDWLFIDVEGYEGKVLAGAAELIQDRGSQLAIIVEMHPTLWPSSGTNATAMRHLLSTLRLAVTPLSGQQDPFGEYGHVLLQSTDAAPWTDHHTSE